MLVGVDALNAIAQLPRRAGHELGHAGQLPAVDDRLRQPVLRLEPGQIPDIVEVENVLSIEAQQPIVEATRTDDVDELTLRVRRGAEGFRPGVGHPEGDAPAEAALQRRLQRVVVGRPTEGLHLHCPVTGIAPQEIGLEGEAAAELQARLPIDRRQIRLLIRHHAIGIEGRILGRPREERAVRDRVDVEVLRQVAREGSDIAHAQHRPIADILLELEAEAVDIGNVALPVGATHIGRAERQLPGALPHRRQVPEVEGRVDKGRRLLDRGEDDVVPGNAVVPDAIPSAQHCLLVAEDIERKAKGGGPLNPAVAEPTALDPLVRLDHAVEGIARTRHDAIGQEGGQQDGRVGRIDRVAASIGAPVETHRLGLIKPCRIEEGSL